MSLNKVTYVENETVIHAQNLNDIQDEIIKQEILSGPNAPTSSTVGVVGKLYLATTEKKIYRCDSVSGNTYTWSLYGGAGGTSDDISNESEVEGETVTDALNTQSSQISALQKLGLTVVNGEICQTYEEDDET